MDYLNVRKLMGHLLNSSLSDFIIFYYIPDVLDYFSIPNSLQNKLEDRYCEYKETPDEKRWTMFGKLHGKRDECAMEEKGQFPTKHWKKCGILHRENDLPAVLIGSVIKQWHIRGKPCRLNPNDPNVIFGTSNGWINENGFYHRDNDLPAYINTSNGVEIFYKWYCNGKPHRLNNPAVINTLDECVEWWKDGKQYTDGTFTTLIC